MQIVRHRIGDAARLLRTARHLQTGQVINRVTRRFWHRLPQDLPAPDLRLANSLWRNCPGRGHAMMSPMRFRFVGQEAEVTAADGWNNPALPRLWLYNLHYFDDLRAEQAEQRSDWHRALIDRWLADNPVGKGTGWEPYPTSLRIVNWIAWSLAGHQLSAAALQSLASQARALRSSLEFHLLGNHLLANAKALIFAGCFFSGKEPEQWLKTGLDLLDTQLREQILGDGGHFELSPMYHSIVLEDLFDLIQLAGLYPAQLESKGRPHYWRAVAQPMMSWLVDMTHPDGEISFFNDAALGIARTSGALSDYAAFLGIPRPTSPGGLRNLSASGYLRLQAGAFTAIVDAAEIGPSYLPGHGHADVLSVEISVDGNRVVTNGGTSTYAEGAVRSQERSTASHATVEINGHSSSEVWGSFRVGRRAHPFDVSAEARDDIVSAGASHDGYRWMPGKPVHRRKVAVSPIALKIVDEVTGSGNHSIVGRLPLHPSVISIASEATAWRLELAGGRMLRVTIHGCSERSLTEGYYAPRFGQRILRPVLAWRHDGRLPLNVETSLEL